MDAQKNFVLRPYGINGIKIKIVSKFRVFRCLVDVIYLGMFYYPLSFFLAVASRMPFSDLINGGPALLIFIGFGIAALATLQSLVWNFFGADILHATPKGLSLWRRGVFFHYPKRFEWHKIKNFEVEEDKDGFEYGFRNHFMTIEYGPIQFMYQGWPRKIGGEDLDLENAQEIVSILTRYKENQIDVFAKVKTRDLFT